MLLLLSLMLASSPQFEAAELTGAPAVERVAELLERPVLVRCVPWSVMYGGTETMNQDPLVCHPKGSDDFQKEFVWNWI